MDNLHTTHNTAIHIQSVVRIGLTIGLMYVTKEVEMWLNTKHSAEQRCTTIVHSPRAVKYTIGWLMSNENIGVSRNFRNGSIILSTHLIGHKHWHAIKPHSLNFYPRVAEVVHSIG